MNYFKRLLIVTVLCLAGLVFSSASVKASVNTPVIEEVIRGAENIMAAPIITGTTDNGTDALIYVDGTYQGTGVANLMLNTRYRFFFQQKEYLSEGIHNIFIVARNKATSELSAPSATVNFIVPADDYEIIAPLVPAADHPSAPTLIRPDEDTITANRKEKITGLTQSGTSVLVYIDGVYNGKTKVISHPSGTGAFYYDPFLALSRGTHEAFAIAVDESGNKSEVSNILYFSIEYPMPAPNMLRAVVNSYSSDSQPFVTGVAKNNSRVKVYVDGKLDGEFRVINQSSGTANFAYKPSAKLSAGKTHKIYAVAADYRGKESAKSNVLSYLYPKPESTAKTAPKQIAGTPKITAPSPDQDKAPEAKKPEPVKPLPEQNEKPGADTENKLPNDKPEINGLENNFTLPNGEPKDSEKVSTSSAWTALSDKLNLNLVIFLVFLAGVIVWIIWVNRELAKERRERENAMNREDEKNEEAKSDDNRFYGNFDQFKNKK